MKKKEDLQRSAKLFESTSEKMMGLLGTLTEEKTIVQFDNLEDRTAFQNFVAEGYASKEYRSYSITEEGKKLLETYSTYKGDKKKFDRLLKIDEANTTSVTYKVHNSENNTIINECAVFDVDTDGIPIIQVSEDVYTNLLHREKGQHWGQYLGEDGRQLIRQKKLSKFYVESEETGRRYLYIVP